MSTPAQQSDPFVKALGLTDLVLMNVVAVVSLRWVARGARMGPASVTLWILAWLAFFVPLAAAVCELSSRDPQQGGLYVWVRKAFGPLHGFISGWCLWVNNLFYFPSLLLFAATNAAAVAGDRAPALAGSTIYIASFVLAAMWLGVVINIYGFNTGKWLQNAGSIGVWIPAALLMGAAGVALARFGSATPFTRSSLLPSGELLDTIALWSAMCFAFSGFEITSLVGQEVRDPRRAIPAGVLIAGALTTVFYIAGSVAVLIAIPRESLRELSGIPDAIDLVMQRLGVSGFGAATGLLLALAAVAGNTSWMAGAARVPFAAGVDRVMPTQFARLHPRFRTPHVTLVIQGVASTIIFLSSLLLTVAGHKPTIQDAYDVLVNLTILIYFIPYLYLFAALPRLRRMAGAATVELRTGIRIPGGRAGLWIVAATGFGATAVSLALTFVPPPGAGVASYEVSLLAQAAVVLAAGAVLYRARARASASASK